MPIDASNFIVEKSVCTDMRHHDRENGHGSKNVWIEDSLGGL
jgi:hypothetical protein